MRKFIVALLFVLTNACSVPQTSETQEDSVAVLSEDTLAIGSADVDQVPVVDTVYSPVALENRITEPVFDPRFAYVYSSGGLDVFKAGDGQEAIGTIDYKQKVELYGNKDGDYQLINFEGKPGYVLNDFLLPLPVPEIENVTEYFLRTLMLTEDPVERKSPESTNPDDMEGSFSFIDYKFENGFKVMTGSQYESGYTNVNLPGLNVHQAFLFASYFYEDFGLFEEYPTAARDEDLPEDRHVIVSVENGEVTVISVGNGSGCYWESSVSGLEDNSGSVMTSGGGC